MKFVKCVCPNNQKSCNSFQSDYIHSTPCVHDNNEFSICMAKIEFDCFKAKSCVEELKHGKTRHRGWLCGNCNSSIDKYDKFCKSCGAMVSWDFKNLIQKKCIHFYDPCEGKCTNICKMYFPVDSDKIYPKRKI